MRFEFIRAEKAATPSPRCAGFSEVSRAGYYAWMPPSGVGRTQEDRRLSVLVRAAHEESRRNYGSPRVHAELAAQR